MKEKSLLITVLVILLLVAGSCRPETSAFQDHRTRNISLRTMMSGTLSFLKMR